MRRIFDWTVANVHSTMNVCWGAMAALYHFHGVQKHVLPEKAFGVYKQTVLRPTSHYLAGFSDDFSIPVSRWAEIRVEDLKPLSELSLLCHSEKGASIVEEGNGQRLYVLDHLEYDGESLADEYFRDVNAHVPIKLPHGYFHDVPKHVLPEKAFGVYKQTVLRPTSHYLAGFADDFSIPVSRWAEIRVDELKDRPELSLLCYSDKGASIVEEDQGKRIYVLDHLEYDGESLADEYFRDVKANVPIKLPHGYFPNDDPNKRPPNRWRAHGHLLISNWINEIYQSSPYDIEKIGETRG